MYESVRLVREIPTGEQNIQFNFPGKLRKSDHVIDIKMIIIQMVSYTLTGTKNDSL
jgi:hypothetical protein